MIRFRSPARWLILAAMLSASANAMCSRGPGDQASAQATSYTTKGVVKSIDTAQKLILIAHEDIPGYMRAMTMGFELKDAEQAKGLAAGDKVSFAFEDDGHGRLVIQTITKTP